MIEYLMGANATIFAMNERITLDWTRIDTVLLDMDGTVLDLAYDSYFWLQHLPRHWGASRNLDAQAALAALMPHFTAHRGDLRWYCLDHWSALLGFDVAALKQECCERICILPGAEDFLRHIQASGRRLLLVTNAHPDSLALKLEQCAIEQYFEVTMSSHELGMAKENADFWPRFAQVYGVDLQRSLFVDDSQAVLRGALAGGLGQVCGILAPDSTTPDQAPFGDWAHTRALADLLPEGM
jgi:HAD superfamily hydrolase (TIGR01509 family)